MTLLDDIRTDARETFSVNNWQVREGRVVPEPSQVGRKNVAVHFECATFFYADLDGSTSLVDSHKWTFSAEVYKTFLYAASRLIRTNGGTITSYDGDRVMGVFVGERQSNAAVDAALKLHWAVLKVLQPALEKQYSTSFRIRHVVGIDASEVRAANAGVRGDNDLVWVGRAPNYAAKLAALPSDYPTRITGEVYDRLNDENKLGGNPRRSMWEQRRWTDMADHRIFRSSFWRSFS